jgi:glycine/D-amino acid oxidase-like deaminating enzyme
MERAHAFEAISPWVRAPEDLQAPLTDDLRADVVIVGGGYTGLSTALSLRAQGADVVVIEKEFAGSGASGRNAGHLTPTIGKDIPTLLRLFGRERAAKLVRFADAAVDTTEEVIRKYGIDCQYDPSGNILAGVHAKHEARLRRAAEAAYTLGAAVRFLSGGEMRERGLPPAFGCGVLEERGGTLDPGRFAMGLRGAAIAAGVRLFEMSPLVELRDAPRASARTQRGSVTADFAVLATNAYTPATGWKRRLVVPIRVSLFETRRLNEDQLAALGWQGREGIYTSHESLESYRLTDRGTIVGGAKVVRYAWGSKLPAGYDPAAFCAIEEAFRDRFPVLGDAKVAHFWGGWIALTLDFLPVLGVTGAQRNVLYGLGYAGHGVAQATQMGAMIADRIQGREHDGEAALRRRVLSWPPEPLRWLGGNLLNGVLSAIDRRTDRQIRAASEDRGAHAPDA